jgi:AraC-like DNA-binding protein
MAVPYFERYHPGWSSDSIRLIPTASDTAKKLYFYIQECGYFRTDRSYYTERENLNSFLVILTLTGCGELKLGGETYELSPGRACLIHCGEHHFYRCAPGGHWEFLWIHFNGSNARGYYEEFVKNGYHLLQCREQSVMEQSLRQIIELHTHTDATTELLCSGLITDILTEFLADTCTGSQPGFAMPDAVRQTRHYIDRHFREPLSLDELAARMHLSKYYLSHAFKKYVGVPVNEYIIRSRISYAKELLRFSRLSVSEITYEVGMNQPSYFIRTFKERESMTPSQFRRQWNDL